MSEFYNNAIFWIEVDKIKPNPFQPRREFDEAKLNDLARSVRQYGILQPLTVSRKEIVKEGDVGLATEYELVAGERRLRAAKLAGLHQVPVLIRPGFDDDKTKLELAIIENLQREDLNPLDRAEAFARLTNEFGFKHTEVASKIGKSREYVSNSLRILMLPEDMRQALAEGKISEGHTRPLLMLIERPAEQATLFKEITLKRLTVRDTEAIARRIATDRVRKKEYLYAPEILQLERDLTEALGTRVAIEPKENGGKLSIDYMSEDDLRALFSKLATSVAATKQEGSNDTVIPEQNVSPPPLEERSSGLSARPQSPSGQNGARPFPQEVEAPLSVETLDDRSKEEKVHDENTFDPKSFSL